MPFFIKNLSVLFHVNDVTVLVGNLQLYLMVLGQKLYRNVKLRAILLKAHLAKSGIHQLSALLSILIRYSG